jgi:hypothetical protein
VCACDEANLCIGEIVILIVLLYTYKCKFQYTNIQKRVLSARERLDLARVCVCVGVPLLTSKPVAGVCVCVCVCVCVRACVCDASSNLMRVLASTGLVCVCLKMCERERQRLCVRVSCQH